MQADCALKRTILVVHRPAILLAWSLTAVLILGAWGCGPGGASGKVSGKVLLRAEPASDVDVVFCRSDGAAVAKASVRQGGEFTFDLPIPAGVYAVMIESNVPESVHPALGEARKPADLRFAGKYGNWKESGLKAEVKLGRNDFTFKLE